jgi:ribonuclease HI
MIYHFYTDGSYKDGSKLGGWAWVHVEYVNQTFQFSTYKAGLAAVIRDKLGSLEIELHAIHQALLWPTRATEIHIYTDSKDAIRVLSGTMARLDDSALLHKIQRRLDHLECEKPPEFHWIPRTSDVFAEYADYLAGMRRKNANLLRFDWFLRKKAELEPF